MILHYQFITVRPNVKFTYDFKLWMPHRGCYNYRPQTKFAKVMFLQVSVCPQGGRAWLLQGGPAWLLRGGCVCAWLLPGGMRGCSQGGMHGCSWGGMHGCSGGGVRGFFDEIRSMSGRYVSYWNAFLF